MPVSYKDLKHKSYYEPTKNFVESLLDIEFIDSKRAHCPFHNDTRDSFRIYFNDKDEIRFHCFGQCGGDWDVYDLIMMKKNCSFHVAWVEFTKFLEIDEKDVHIQRRQKEEPDDPILQVDTEDLTDQHREVLQAAAGLYCNLLLSRKDKFEKAFKYLESRGVDEETIQKFNIGFSPALEDKKFRGRALLSKYTDQFMKDLNKYQLFRRAGLFRLLNDETSPGYKYYRLHIDASPDNPFGAYSDYFLNRITFPIYNIKGQIEGIIGRRLDNRGLRWLKQSQQETYLKRRGWLYGIDKSARGIKEYQTAIIVEGIFDFFAFYNISENKERPIVVSTLGSNIEKNTISLLIDLGVKNLIIAFDWDPAGMRAIRNAANEIKEVNISYLGSLKEGEDPADRLQGILSKVSNFGIRHLQKGMESKSRSGKSVMASFMVQQQEKDKLYQDEILLKPAETLTGKPIQKEEDIKDFWYKISDIMGLLSYDHKNRAQLDNKLDQVRSVLEKPLKDTPAEQDRPEYFSLPRKFIEDEIYQEIGDALIFHLRLAIEQQKRKRRIKETDSTIAEWLKTSRKTIFNYKTQLKDLNLLNIDKSGKIQKISVKFFSKKEYKTNKIE